MPLMKEGFHQAKQSLDQQSTPGSLPKSTLTLTTEPAAEHRPAELSFLSPS